MTRCSANAARSTIRPSPVPTDTILVFALLPKQIIESDTIPVLVLFLGVRKQQKTESSSRELDCTLMQVKEGKTHIPHP